MPRVSLGTTTFDAALERTMALYERDDRRVVCSFSAGKDSGVCLELAIMAAEATGKLPVDVVMRDDEVMFPGTFEYAERIAARPEVRFHWLIAGQPVINVFNRAEPYFWCFDDRLTPDEWVRKPPGYEAAGEPRLTPGLRWHPEAWANEGYVEVIPDQFIEAITQTDRFPVDGELFDVVGLRVQESRGRLFGIYASKGYLTGANRYGVRKARPIYDWTDGDVWKAMGDLVWDYNQAYDVLHRLGVARHKLRIAPPTMNPAGVPTLALARAAWPHWFDRVDQRLPGVRSVAMFGMRAVAADRRFGESWEDCFRRTCIGEGTPPWIAERAMTAMTKTLEVHRSHARTPLPESETCWQCNGELGSWRGLVRYLYGGDPFVTKSGGTLKVIEPEFFREGAGTWGGTPAFS